MSFPMPNIQASAGRDMLNLSDDMSDEIKSSFGNFQGGNLTFVDGSNSAVIWALVGIGAFLILRKKRGG